MATKLKLAQQAQMLLGYKPSLQEMMLATNQAYGAVVMKNWWMGKTQGENDINGNFIYSFDSNPILLDTAKNLYYSTLPSSFLGNIPHEMGIPHVSYMESYNKPFIRLSNGQPALFRGLQSENMEGNDTFFVENNKVYLPTITDAKYNTPATPPTLLIKLVVALEGLDEQTEISIPPDIQQMIVGMVVQMYSQQQDGATVKSLPVEQGNKP